MAAARPGVPQGPDEREVHHLRDGERHDGDLHRRADVLPRIEARRQHLHEDQPDQAHAVGDQRLARHLHVVRAERAVVKQRRDQRHGEDRQRHGRRRREQQRQAQAPVEQPRVLLARAVGMAAREARQQDRAQGDAEHAGGELHQPVGVVEPGHAAGHEERGEDAVDQQRDLADRHAEDRRPHLPQHAPHALVAQVEPDPRQHADARREGQLEAELQHAAQEHRPGRAPSPAGRSTAPGTARTR